MSATDGKNKLISKWRVLRFWAIKFAVAHGRRIVRGRQVSIIHLHPGLAHASHVVIMVVHNEATRIGFLLDYYRRMGFAQFIVIDNESSDDLVRHLNTMDDVSIFRANGSFKKARFGMDWVNYVLSRYCAGKWVLHVDADEFLVYSAPDGFGIKDVTHELESRKRDSLQALMLDMYSDKSVSENLYGPGTDPLSVCSLYDSSGYSTQYEEVGRTTWIKGGVRARLFFPDVWDGPALNKTPLVRWRRHFAFIRVAHLLFPPRLNGPGKQEIRELQGTLLHFKFLSDFGDKLAMETKRQQHTAEYDAYRDVAGAKFVSSVTRQYRDADSLVRDELLRPIRLNS